MSVLWVKTLNYIWLDRSDIHIVANLYFTQKAAARLNDILFEVVYVKRGVRLRFVVATLQCLFRYDI